MLVTIAAYYDHVLCCFRFGAVRYIVQKTGLHCWLQLLHIMTMFRVSDLELYSIWSIKVLVTVAAYYDHGMFCFVSESELYSICNTVHKTGFQCWLQLLHVMPLFCFIFQI